MRVSSSRIRSRLTCPISRASTRIAAKVSALDVEAKPRRKPHRAQHAQLVLGEAPHRLPDRPHYPRPQVLAPAYIIQHRSRRIAARQISIDIQQHSVDGEIPPQHILLRIVRVRDLIRPPPIAVCAIGPERRHLGDNLSPVHLQRHQHHPKMRPHPKRPPEQRHHCIGTSIRRHVVVGRRAAHQQVAHASAHQIRAMPRGHKRVHHRRRGFQSAAEHDTHSSSMDDGEQRPAHWIRASAATSGIVH